jgi:acyl-coenzyme A synthetase/AMP-(fatty) acid ligase
MAYYGKMDQHRFDSLRLVLFAGEVFPIKPLVKLQAHWPQAAYYNLYGPTETNVCTYYKVPNNIDAQQHASFPIGKACAHCAVDIIDAQGESATEGELIVSGAPVMPGYLGRPEVNAQVFVTRVGKMWYRTGDIVRRRDDGLIDFIGRKDRMVKRRGYRIELGEIEAVLRHHADVAEAAVTSATDTDGVVRIHAHVGWNYREAPSLVGMKQFCAENLPMYMVPDSITFHNTLPKTSTNKVDYQALLSNHNGV